MIDNRHGLLMLRRMTHIRILAAVLAAAASLIVVVSPASAARYWYVTPGQMEGQLTEYGLTWGHHNHAVLSANCVGQGKPGRKRLDPVYQFMMPTYHLFECAVTVRRVPDLELIHVETRGKDHWAWEEI